MTRPERTDEFAVLGAVASGRMPVALYNVVYDRYVVSLVPYFVQLTWPDLDRAAEAVRSTFVEAWSGLGVFAGGNEVEGRLRAVAHRQGLSLRDDVVGHDPADPPTDAFGFDNGPVVVGDGPWDVDERTRQFEFVRAVLDRVAESWPLPADRHLYELTRDRHPADAALAAELGVDEAEAARLTAELRHRLYVSFAAELMVQEWARGGPAPAGEAAWCPHLIAIAAAGRRGAQLTDGQRDAVTAHTDACPDRCGRWRRRLLVEWSPVLVPMVGALRERVAEDVRALIESGERVEDGATTALAGPVVAVAGFDAGPDGVAAAVGDGSVEVAGPTVGEVVAGFDPGAGAAVAGLHQGVDAAVVGGLAPGAGGGVAGAAGAGSVGAGGVVAGLVPSAGGGVAAAAGAGSAGAATPAGAALGAGQGVAGVDPAGVIAASAGAGSAGAAGPTATAVGAGHGVAGVDPGAGAAAVGAEAGPVGAGAGAVEPGGVGVAAGADNGSVGAGQGGVDLDKGLDHGVLDTGGRTPGGDPRAGGADAVDPVGALSYGARPGGEGTGGTGGTDAGGTAGAGSTAPPVSGATTGPGRWIGREPASTARRSGGSDAAVVASAPPVRRSAAGTRPPGAGDRTRRRLRMAAVAGTVPLVLLLLGVLYLTLPRPPSDVPAPIAASGVQQGTEPTDETAEPTLTTAAEPAPPVVEPEPAPPQADTEGGPVRAAPQPDGAPRDDAPPPAAPVVRPPAVVPPPVVPLPPTVVTLAPLPPPVTTTRPVPPLVTTTAPSPPVTTTVRQPPPPPRTTTPPPPPRTTTPPPPRTTTPPPPPRTTPPPPPVIEEPGPNGDPEPSEVG